MKAMAASSIGEYEIAVAVLRDYFATIEYGLALCFRLPDMQPKAALLSNAAVPCVVVFGSDQGLVGQFNDSIANSAITTIASLTQPGSEQPLVWAVGERVYQRLIEAGLVIQNCFTVPTAVKSITPLVGDILLATATQRSGSALTELHLIYNRPSANAAYFAVSQQLLPLSQQWCKQLAEKPWPTPSIAEILGSSTDTLAALIHEYLFVSLFRASAESLASENASRLAAMQRADKNIAELVADLKQNYYRVRQASIDAEMFDVIAGSLR